MPLSQLVRPHVAIITNVEPVHLEFFGTLEEIADAKAEIFFGLEPDGIVGAQSRQCAISSACATAREAAGVTRIVTFGERRASRCAIDRRRRCRPDVLDRAGQHSRPRRDL